MTCKNGSQCAIEQLRKELKTKKIPWSVRSCWNCNPSHEHLKTSTCLIACPHCGHFYYKGMDITK